MDPALGSAIGSAAEQGGFAVISILLLWFLLRELREFLKTLDGKIDKASEGIARNSSLLDRLLRALGEKE